MIRTSPLLAILVSLAVITAGLTVLQLWFDYFLWDTFVKIVISLSLIGTMAAFLTAVDYDMPASKSRRLLGAAIFIAVALVILVLAQLWWPLMSSDIFSKVGITGVVLLGVVSFVIAAKEDFSSEKNLKEDKFVN